MNISVLGAATSKFGELWEMSPRTLAKQVMTDAISQSGLEATDIDALFVGNMLSGNLGNQANLGSLFAEELGVYVPAFRLEGACASGGLALNTAINSIKAGQYRNALVLGVEKMTDHTQDDITWALMSAGSDEERSAGITFPGLYALMARAYMEQYGVDEETLASVSVKNHLHGSLNPKAQFQTPISIETVMKSGKISDPLKLLDCSPISDGAAAIVIAGSEKISQGAIRITASEVSTDSLSLCERKVITSLASVVGASARAYGSAGLGPSDIDVAEIHDCFSIAEAIATEDLGFSKRGEGARDIASGKYTLNKGKLITNPSGGLKACGHPVGATGIKQIVEIVEQLRGSAGSRQVKNARTGLTHNVGGSGAISVIHILQK